MIRNFNVAFAVGLALAAVIGAIGWGIAYFVGLGPTLLIAALLFALIFGLFGAFTTPPNRRA